MAFGKPRRLEWIFEKYEPPLYFVTICTQGRKRVLANEAGHCALKKYGEVGSQKNVALGRYVIIPDHIHLFVRLGAGVTLGIWIAGLKRVVAAPVTGGRGLWQRGFFDHVIRNSESYSEKWNYVRDNPVRGGLVKAPDDWPYQGEVVLIHHH